MALLSVENLTVDYRTSRGSVRAVDGASLDIPEGAIVGLVGESGCGKTTVARAIMGVMPRNAAITGGRLKFHGRNLTDLDRHSYRALRWREIAFVPQSAMSSLNPVHRVGAQLIEVLTVRGSCDKREAWCRAVELFDMVGLDPRRLQDYPHQFSGGMRQRVAIAMALALEPKLVIADEPVTALDVIVQRQVLDCILGLQQRLGLSVLLVTHDMSVVAYACNRTVVMYAGRVMESGATDVVLGSPKHPYTMGLCNAFPDLEAARHALVPIEGRPPDLAEPPAGCRFAPRCPFSLARCEAEAPPPLDGDHEVSCWRHAEAAVLLDQAKEPRTWLRS